MPTNPIDDQYIDSVVKANAADSTTTTKTLGTRLRGLFKSLRDRLEQQTGLALSQISTEITDRQAADNNLSQQISTLSGQVVHNSIVGVANGVAPLDASAKISSTYLPSYVDDIVEANTFNALPNPGETGKIYVTLDSNLEYRWSGSSYIQLVPSPGSTDAIPEGTNHRYYTDARVQAFADAVYAHKNGDNVSGQWPINITGNAGSISGQANSATIPANTGVAGNTIVQRDGSGHINANYFHTSAPINDGTTMGYFIGEDNAADGYLRPYSVGAAQAALGLNSGAFNDKTKLWSESHPNNFYIVNNWDGAYWQVTSNHGSPVSVGHSSNAEYLGNDAAYMRMHWNGQGGQPTWLWGGNDPNNMYVYNPSNFSVAYASNAGALNGLPSSYFYPASNPNGYISGYAETDTLQSVTNRGNSTSNSITAAGFYQSSLRSLKENIKAYDQDTLSLINSLQVQSFNYYGSKEGMIGLIVDEVQETNPDILDSGKAAINTNNLVAQLVKAVQQLTKKVEELENGRLE